LAYLEAPSSWAEQEHESSDLGRILGMFVAVAC